MCVDNALGSRGNNYKTGLVIFFYVPVECPPLFAEQTKTSKSHLYYCSKQNPFNVKNKHGMDHIDKLRKEV